MVKLSTCLALLLCLIYLQPERSFSYLEWSFRIGSDRQHHSGLTYKGNVSWITMREGYYTTTRRSVRQKQVHCYGHNCHLARVTKAVCRNIRFNGRTITWACDLEIVSSNRQHNCKAGQNEVNCEYAGRNDEYIVNGSCSFRYTIDAQSCTSSSSGGSIGVALGEAVVAIFDGFFGKRGSSGGPPPGPPPGPPNGHPGGPPYGSPGDPPYGPPAPPPGPPSGGPSGGQEKDKDSSLTLIMTLSLVILASILVALIVAIILGPSKRKVRAPKRLQHRNIGGHGRHDRHDRDSSTTEYDGSTTSSSLTSD